MSDFLDSGFTQTSRSLSSMGLGMKSMRMTKVFAREEVQRGIPKRRAGGQVVPRCGSIRRKMAKAVEGCW